MIVDIEETGNLNYINQLTEILVAKLNSEKDTISKILSGALREEINQLFLT